MKNGKCPKCGNTDILAVKRPTFTGTAAGNILGEYIPLGFGKGASIQHYVCMECGYLEHYVVDNHIAKLPK